MDRMLYVAMTGAKETLRAQAVNNHNLANASTTGFRADLSAFQSRAVDGSGYASRVYATNATVGLGRPVRRAALDRPRSRRRDQRRGLDRGAGPGRQGSVHARRRSAGRSERPAHHRHRPPRARRWRPDQRAAVHVHLLRARRIDLGRGAGPDARTPRRRSARIKLVNPADDAARARRRRPVPHEGRQRRAGGRQRAARLGHARVEQRQYRRRHGQHDRTGAALRNAGQGHPHRGRERRRRARSSCASVNQENVT